jgi:hypothetical protein
MANILKVYRKAVKIEEELAETVRLLPQKGRIGLCAQIVVSFLINCGVFQEQPLIDLLKKQQKIRFPKGVKFYWTHADGSRVRSKKELKKLVGIDKKLRVA